MAMKISDECSECGTCSDECENNAISEGDGTYVIDQAKCTECEGIADAPKCAEECPMECIVKAE